LRKHLFLDILVFMYACVRMVANGDPTEKKESRSPGNGAATRQKIVCGAPKGNSGESGGDPMGEKAAEDGGVK
jgi:hypothetical protein